MGRFCSYLLPKQDGRTCQIEVNPTKVLDHQSHPVVWFPEEYLNKLYTKSGNSQKFVPCSSLSSSTVSLANSVSNEANGVTAGGKYKTASRSNSRGLYETGGGGSNGFSTFPRYAGVSMFGMITLYGTVDPACNAHGCKAKRGVRPIRMSYNLLVRQSRL